MVKTASLRHQTDEKIIGELLCSCHMSHVMICVHAEMRYDESFWESRPKFPHLLSLDLSFLKMIEWRDSVNLCLFSVLVLFYLYSYFLFHMFFFWGGIVWVNPPKKKKKTFFELSWLCFFQHMTSLEPRPYTLGWDNPAPRMQSAFILNCYWAQETCQ